MSEYDDMGLNTAKKEKTFKRLFGKLYQLLARKTPFIPGKLRVLLQSMHGVQFLDVKSTFLGEDVFFDDIHPELITVGKNVRITAGVRILTHFFDTRFVPKLKRPFRFYTGAVIIGDNVFIGVNTVVAKPVKIGSGAVIGANSVVTRDIPANAIAVGSPAKVVGYRPEMKND
jgi:acetyltransferase-like isoleucine patch superfamily enzyme